MRVLDGEGEALNRNIVHAEGSDRTIEPVPPMVVPVESISGYTPMQVIFGASFKPFRGTLIANDLVWKQWSTWRSFSGQNPILGSATRCTIASAWSRRSTPGPRGSKR
ncbi:MAG: hypothetical protein M5R36_23335 [Deltaproteobacteria bacterium]|nr:hypothetical protein [Deltaproteobacteria bacterium]